MPTTQPLSRDPALDVEAFWFRYRGEILIFVVVLLLAAAGWNAFQFYVARRDSAAAIQLAAAKTPRDYEDLIAQHGNTPAGASACLFLAEAQRKDRKFAESSATLQAFIDKHPEHELVPTAKMAIASNLESTGKIDEALSLCKQIAEKYPKNYVAPLALMSQVSLFKAKNQPDAVRRACETILSQYGDSFWANEAMRELRSLKPGPSVQGSGKASPDPAATSSPAEVRPPIMVPGPAPAA
jgi:predicted negative regulator of RcsB-dependent stress response